MSEYSGAGLAAATLEAGGLDEEALEERYCSSKTRSCRDRYCSAKGWKTIDFVALKAAGSDTVVLKVGGLDGVQYSSIRSCRARYCNAKG